MNSLSEYERLCMFMGCLREMRSITKMLASELRFRMDFYRYMEYLDSDPFESKRMTFDEWIKEK